MSGGLQVDEPAVARGSSALIHAQRADGADAARVPEPRQNPLRALGRLNFLAATPEMRHGK